MRFSTSIKYVLGLLLLLSVVAICLDLPLLRNIQIWLATAFVVYGAGSLLRLQFAGGTSIRLSENSIAEIPPLKESSNSLGVMFLSVGVLFLFRCLFLAIALAYLGQCMTALHPSMLVAQCQPEYTAPFKDFLTHLTIVFKYTAEPLATLLRFLVGSQVEYVLKASDPWAMVFRTILYVSFSIVIIGGGRSILKLGAVKSAEILGTNMAAK